MGPYNPVAGKDTLGLDSPCMECRFYHWRSFGTCDAFPDRIPQSIWSGNDRHLGPVEGDHGLLFDPVSLPP